MVSKGLRRVLSAIPALAQALGNRTCPSKGCLWVKKPQEAGPGPRLLPQGPWRNHIMVATASTIPQ